MSLGFSPSIITICLADHTLSLGCFTLFWGTVVMSGLISGPLHINQHFLRSSNITRTNYYPRNHSFLKVEFSLSSFQTLEIWKDCRVLVLSSSLTNWKGHLSCIILCFFGLERFIYEKELVDFSFCTFQNSLKMKRIDLSWSLNSLKHQIAANFSI